jgi:hypothetical protein
MPSYTGDYDFCGSRKVFGCALGAIRPLLAFFDASARMRSNFCLGVSGALVKGDDFGFSFVYRTTRSSSFPPSVIIFSFSYVNFFLPYLSLCILSAYGLGNPLLVIHL